MKTITKSKSVLTILLAVFYSLNTHAQTFDSLNINNINAGFNAGGDLFWDLIGTPKFEVPKGSGKHCIYAGNIWLGGLDANDSLHLAAQRFAQVGRDFWAGPIADSYNALYDSTYNRLWKINKSEIDNHIANWDSVGYTIPASISEWSAHGNVSNGEAYNLAPFVDLNENNIYEPENGDYPDIRGDMAVFFIFNDTREIHTETGGKVLGVEVRAMAYAYDLPSDSALYNTIFLNYNIINRSDTTYSDFYLGTFIDFDIGNYQDDYIGCDSTLNTFFGYNGDSVDNGIYGVYPPAQGVTFLSSPISSFVYFNNTPSSPMSDPDTAAEYYGYLKGLWKDSTLIYYGGTGHASGPNTSNTITHFVFSGDPNDSLGWTEITENNPVGDRRGVGAIGPFILSAGENICIDIAFINARDYSGDNLSSVTLLKQRALAIQSFYDSQDFDCPPIEMGVNAAFNENNNNFYVYPNPSKDYVYLEYELPKGKHKGKIIVYNLAGKEIKRISISNSTNNIKLNNSTLPSGTYIYQLVSGEYVSAEKVIIIK